MFETLISSSGNSIDKVMDEYHDTTSYSGSNSSASNSSSGGNTIDEEYTSGVLGAPLEVFQEQLKKKAASRSQAGTSMSVPPSSPLDKVETVYSCAVGIYSKTNEQKLNNLRTWYQILDELNPRLAVCEAYFLGGFRLPLNAFARELLVKLGLAVCQFNPNAWRLIISMQILWREVFGEDYPLTVDEFLFCYKPLEINQSLGFYQFIARVQIVG